MSRGTARVSSMEYNNGWACVLRAGLGLRDSPTVDEDRRPPLLVETHRLAVDIRRW
jgi:hypothetical protein